MSRCIHVYPFVARNYGGISFSGVCPKINKTRGSDVGVYRPPPSSVMGNALVVIDDGIESVNLKNRYQGARVSARRANREPEDGIRWKFVHGRVVVVR